jgi:NADH-quinone oxidoreductase subunit H
LPRHITTFEGFLRQVVVVLVALAVILAVLSVPAYFVAKAYLGLNIYALIGEVASNPMKVMNYTMQHEVLWSLFLWTTFPGFTFAALFSSILMIWVERKFVAKVQLRVGPQYAGRFEGILQNFADLFKLLFKEIIVPYKADRGIFLAVPLATMFVSGALLALVPLSQATYIANPSVGVVLIFALIGFSPIIALLGGWASNNKYSLIGGLRALHQMVAYEIPMLISVLGVVVLSGSLSLIGVAEAQSSIWFIVLQPLGAFVFFVAVLAELERIPFDLPEADSELVAGWQTEYSGMAYGIFQLATYIKFYALAGIFTIFFLGGWYGPSPVPPEVWFILKTFLVMLAMMLPRAVMPRVRIDILLRSGWTRLMLLSFASLFMALVVVSLGLYHIGGV